MLGLCDLVVESLVPQPHTEFLCRLRRADGPIVDADRRRLELLQSMVEETVEQGLQLPGSTRREFDDVVADQTVPLRDRIAELERHVANQDEAIAWLRQRRTHERRPLLAKLWHKLTRS